MDSLLSQSMMQCVNGGGAVDEADNAQEIWTVDDKCTDRRVIINKDGLGLQVFEWYPRQQVRGIVILFHGIDVNSRFEYLRLRSMDFADDDLPEGMDGLKYDRSLIANLNEAGFICISADMQGYGCSEGIKPKVRAYFDSFQSLIDDAVIICKETAQKYANTTKIFLLGTSYGGLVVTSLCTRLSTLDKNGHDTDFISRLAGIILLAPALSLEKIKAEPANAILLPIATLLSAAFPTLAVGKKAENPNFPQLVDAMHIDAALDPQLNPHCTGCYTGKLRARVGKQTLDAIETLRYSISNVSTTEQKTSILFNRPLLIIHSKYDTMTDPEGSAFLAHTIPQQDHNVSLVYTQDIPGCENMWHCLTQEPGCEALFLHVSSWLTTHSPSNNANNGFSFAESR